MTVHPGVGPIRLPLPARCPRTVCTLGVTQNCLGESLGGFSFAYRLRFNGRFAVSAVTVVLERSLGARLPGSLERSCATILTAIAIQTAIPATHAAGRAVVGMFVRESGEAL